MSAGLSSADKRLMKDCLALHQTLGVDEKLGLMNESELRARAESHLVSLATKIVQAEIGGDKMSEEQEARRAYFKQDHAVLQKFALVDGDGKWNRYFTVAQAQLEGQPTETSEKAEVVEPK